MWISYMHENIECESCIHWYTEKGAENTAWVKRSCLALEAMPGV